MPLIIEKPRFLEPLSLHLTLLIVILSPLALGAVHPVSISIFTATSLLALLFHIIARKNEHRRITTSYIGLPFFIGALFALAMVFPLPHFLRKILAPDATQILDTVSALLPLAIRKSVWPVLSWNPPETALRLLQLLCASCIFIVISDRARDKSTYKFIFRYILVGAYLVVTVSILHRLMGLEQIWGHFGNSERPFFAPLINANNLARVFGTFSFLSLAGAFLARYKLERFAFILAAILCGAGVYLTLSRAGIILFSFLMLLMGFYLWFKQNNRSPWSILTLFLACFIGLYIANEAIFARLGTLQSEINRPAKTVLYEPAWNIFKHTWLSGVGPGGIGMAFHMGVENRSDLPDILTSSYQVPYFENIFLDTAIEHGVFKAIILFFIVLWVFKNLKNISHSYHQKILLTISVFIVVGDFFDFSLQTGSMLWLIALILACLSTALSKDQFYLWRCKWQPAIGLWLLAVILTGILAPYSIAHVILDYPSRATLQQEQYMLAHHPFDAKITDQLSRYYRETGDFPHAASFVDLTLQLWPGYTQGLLEKARLLYIIDKKDLSLELYRQAYISHLNQEASIMKEVALLFTNPSEQAKIIFPKTAHNLEIFCNQLQADHHLELCQICYEEMSQLPDATPSQQIRDLQFALEQGNLIRAFERLKSKIAYIPLDGDFALLTAKILAAVHGPQIALDTSFTWLHALQEPEKLLWWQLNTAIDLHQFSLAWEILKKLENSTFQSSEFVSLKLAEVKIYDAQKEPSKSLKILEKLTRMVPNDTGLLLQRGWHELDLGMVEQANDTKNILSSLPVSPSAFESFATQVNKAQKTFTNEKLKLITHSF